MISCFEKRVWSKFGFQKEKIIVANYSRVSVLKFTVLAGLMVMMGGVFGARVMVFGVFDLLHDGHRAFLQQAQEHGSELIVIVTRDSVVQRLKNKLPHEHQDLRMRNVRLVAGVTDVLLGDEILGTYTALKKYLPDIICLGYDQKALADDLKQRMARGALPLIPLIFLHAYKPEIFHTSLLNIKNT